MDGSCIDLANLERLFKGDRSRVLQWIKLYLEESPIYFALLSNSLATGDANGIASAAHDLRPQAHYLGADRMLEMLITLKERALTEGAPCCASIVEQLLDLSAKINTELREMTRPVI